VNGYQKEDENSDTDEDSATVVEASNNINSREDKGNRQRLSDGTVQKNVNEMIGKQVVTAISSGTASSLENDYIMQCRLQGTMDSTASFANEVKKITKRWGWKLFKMLNKDDYDYRSDFAECMLGYINMSSVEDRKRDSVRKADWEKVQLHVASGMMAARSACTQALKSKFLSKYSERVHYI
jgi:hypothetical protein